MRFAESVEVWCETTRPGFAASHGSAVAAVTDGNFNGTVTVAFNAVHPADAAFANAYSCYLLVHYRRPDGGYGAFDFRTPAGGAALYTTQTGQSIASHSPVFGSTTGTLP
jgi:hypothetical protein